MQSLHLTGAYSDELVHHAGKIFGKCLFNELGAGTECRSELDPSWNEDYHYPNPNTEGINGNIASSVIGKDKLEETAHR